LTDYARVVAEDEWDAMDAGEAPEPRAEELVDQLWAQVQASVPATPEAATAYAAMIDALDDQGNARRVRLLESREGLPGVMWVVLVAGGVLAVGFGYGFGVENPRSHAALLGTLAASLALLLFLVYVLNHPFRGEVRVEPEAFELVSAQIAGT
jgi:hypothetical protein